MAKNEIPTVTLTTQKEGFGVNFDSFLENLPLWSNKEPVDAFFSVPIAGINQFLADTKHRHVGAYGENLIKYIGDIRNHYQLLGYTVIIDQKIFPPIGNKIKIIFED